MKIRWLVNNEGITKASLSSILLILSIVIAIISKNAVIFVGMLASSVGDFCIMASRGVFRNRKYNYFEGGIVAFAIAHLAYAAIMFDTYLKLGIVVLVMFVLMIAIMCSIFFKNIIKITPILMALYALILILDFVMALHCNKLTAIGLGFFIVSDSILALKEDKERIWQVPIWIFYVIAQVCILISFKT